MSTSELVFRNITCAVLLGASLSVVSVQQLYVLSLEGNLDFLNEENIDVCVK